MPARASTSASTSVSAYEAAVEVRVVVGRLLRRMREVATGGELTPSQASVLARLGKGEAATAAGLAALEKVRPQSMAVTLAALEERGLIVRSPDPGDGRRQVVELSAAGRDSDRGNAEAREEWLTTALDERLTGEERARVVEALALLDRLVRE